MGQQLQGQQLQGQQVQGAPRAQIAQPTPPPAGPRRSRAPMAVAAVVVGIVVLAALYFLVFAAAKPTVQFGPPTRLGEGFTASVTGVSAQVAGSRYRMNLAEDGTPGVAARLAIYVNLTVAGNAYVAGWLDAPPIGIVNAGDAFAVVPVSGALTGTAYVLQLLWDDGSVVGSVEYRPTSSKPLVAFSTPSPSSDGFGFQVAGVSDARAIGSFRVNFTVDTATGAAVPLGAQMTFTINSVTYNVTYTDVGGVGYLTAGDSFDVSTSGGLTPGVTYGFQLLWSDDTLIGQTSYTA